MGLEMNGFITWQPWQYINPEDTGFCQNDLLLTLPVWTPGHQEEFLLLARLCGSLALVSVLKIKQTISENIRFFNTHTCLSISWVRHKRHRHQSSQLPASWADGQWEESMCQADQWEIRRLRSLVTHFIWMSSLSASPLMGMLAGCQPSLTGPITKPEATRFFFLIFTKVHFVHSH